MEFNAAEEIGGEGGGLKEPGIFQMQVLEAFEGETHKGNVIEGFATTLSVVGAKEGSEELIGKTLHVTWWSPQGDKSDGYNKWAVKKQTAFLIATNVLKPEQLGSSVNIDLSKSVGHHFLIELEKDGREDQDGLQVKYANVYHVDDPRAAKLPRNADAIAQLPEEFRHAKDAKEYFAKITGKKPANGATAVTKPQLSEADLDEI